MMHKRKFLEFVGQRLLAKGHSVRKWQRTKLGFISVCGECGATTSVTIKNNKIREFPQRLCVIEKHSE